MYRLLPHPASLPPAYVASLSAHSTRQADGSLLLAYTLYTVQGQHDCLQIPAPLPPALADNGFADNLWQHTCFEAFIRPTGQSAYREFNFSPSGQWAVYDFSGYRDRVEQPLPQAAPRIVLTRPAADTLHLEVTIPAALLPMLATGEPPCQLSLTAMLEDTEGTCSYWATHHAGERPDFHHPEAFTLCLA
jgi:hypothetical protein